MKFTGFFHSAYHSIAIYLETVKYLCLMRLRVYRQYMPEIASWLLFAVCLAALTFVLGLTAGMMLG
jgi:hypothetical protein